MDQLLVFIFHLELLVVLVKSLISNLSFSEPHEHFKITSGQPDFFIIELVRDIPPPLRVIGLFNKLGDLIFFNHFFYLLATYSIAFVIVEVIPFLGHVADPQ